MKRGMAIATAALWLQGMLCAVLLGDTAVHAHGVEAAHEPQAGDAHSRDHAGACSQGHAAALAGDDSRGAGAPVDEGTCDEICRDLESIHQSTSPPGPASDSVPTPLHQFLVRSDPDIGLRLGYRDPPAPPQRIHLTHCSLLI